MSEIAANLEAVCQRITAAAQRVGRRPETITLVAVTKSHPLEVVIEAYEAGLRDFGENRVDEWQTKIPDLAAWLQDQGQSNLARWHYIGHIQSRQAGPVLGMSPSLLHSVDSVALAQRLDRLARRDNLPPVDILLQCNVSGEESKSGFNLQRWQTEPPQFQRFSTTVAQIAALEKINLVGLMTMAPYSDEAEDSRPVFKSLARLKTKLESELPHLTWQHLSMGMTNDFEVGIEEGATLVRVGRALFGEREY
jgi:hypothetical protein